MSHSCVLIHFWTFTHVLFLNIKQVIVLLQGVANTGDLRTQGICMHRGFACTGDLRKNWNKLKTYLKDIAKLKQLKCFRKQLIFIPKKLTVRFTVGRNYLCKQKDFKEVLMRLSRYVTISIGFWEGLKWSTKVETNSMSCGNS